MDQNNKKDIIQQIIGFLQQTDRSNFLVRIGLSILVFVGCIIYFKYDSLVSIYTKTRTEEVMKQLQQTREQLFINNAKEQLSITYPVIHPDLVMIVEYKPLHINNFGNLIAYEGKWPDGFNTDFLTKVPVNKLSDEYLSHLTRSYYEGKTLFNALTVINQYDEPTDLTYSCAIFNLEDTYTGYVSYIWYKNAPTPEFVDKMVRQSCNSVSRILGRSK